MTTSSKYYTVAGVILAVLIVWMIGCGEKKATLINENTKQVSDTIPQRDSVLQGTFYSSGTIRWGWVAREPSVFSFHLIEPSEQTIYVYSDSGNIEYNVTLNEVSISGDTLDVIKYMMKRLMQPVVIITSSGDTLRKYNGDTLRSQPCSIPIEQIKYAKN